MAENNDKSTGKKPDKSLKPQFNSNWIWVILLVSILLFEDRKSVV